MTNILNQDRKLPKMSTYSNARAEPSAILTRVFQVSGFVYSSER